MLSTRQRRHSHCRGHGAHSQARAIADKPLPLSVQQSNAQQRTLFRLLAGLLGGLVVRAGDVALLGLAHSGLQAFKTMERQWELGEGSRLRPLWQGQPQQ